MCLSDSEETGDRNGNNGVFCELLDYYSAAAGVWDSEMTLHAWEKELRGVSARARWVGQWQSRVPTSPHQPESVSVVVGHG